MCHLFIENTYNRYISYTYMYVIPLNKIYIILKYYNNKFDVINGNK